MKNFQLPVLPMIDSNQALNDYCQQLALCSVFALDTEFLRVNTFFPKPGLFQINDGQQIVLVDPLAIDDWQAFSAILSDENIVKVLHACDEDIELLYHFLSVEVKNVFDTQVAAAFCGYDFCMGYQRLVAAMCDCDIEKGESRSDWMKRPLSPEQLSYAANDVLYLLDMHQQLLQKLQSNNGLPFVQAEYDAVVKGVSNDDFGLAYKRLKQAWKLNAQQFARLKALACWREEKMREKNMPRNKVAKNEALMMLAVKPNIDHKALFRVEGLPLPTAKNLADELLSLIAADYSSAVDVLERPVKAEPLLNRIKSTLLSIATQHDMAEQMLSKKAYNEALFRLLKNQSTIAADDTSAGLVEALSAVVTDWRQPFYVQALTEIQQS